MSDLLRRLREKPMHERKAIAFSVSGAIISIIFLVWISVTANTLLAPQEERVVEAVTQKSIETQKASVFEGVKQKTLLFIKEGSFFEDVALRLPWSVIEYKQAVATTNATTNNRDALPEVSFNSDFATSSLSSMGTTTNPVTADFE